LPEHFFPIIEDPGELVFHNQVVGYISDESHRKFVINTIDHAGSVVADLLQLVEMTPVTIRSFDLHVDKGFAGYDFRDFRKPAFLAKNRNGDFIGDLQAVVHFVGNIRENPELQFRWGDLIKIARRGDKVPEDDRIDIESQVAFESVHADKCSKKKETAPGKGGLLFLNLVSIVYISGVSKFFYANNLVATLVFCRVKSLVCINNYVTDRFGFPAG